jgi:uncharacterized membrane protein YhaH (DUF805 family)
MNWYLTVLKKYAIFNGRARRKEYWMFVLFNAIVSIVLGIVDAALQLNVIGTIYSVAVLIPSIAVGVRRMHDVNKSGWFLLIPIYNLVLACTNGDVGENKYGPDPKNDNVFSNDALDSHMTN